MIMLGSFSFPTNRTIVRLSMLEAKSKVRKEIRIQSMLQGHTRLALEEQVDLLRRMLEAFDRQEENLSLQSGRYYQGRRREFHLTPCPDSLMTWVDLTILTNDRFERSLLQHEYSSEWSGGAAELPILNQGNWKSPLSIQLTPQTPLSQIQLLSSEGLFTMQYAMDAGAVLNIEAESRLVSLNNINIPIPAEEPFPLLQPGLNHLCLTTVPEDAHGNITVRYRDCWV